jgi:hypothetical protein
LRFHLAKEKAAGAFQPPENATEIRPRLKSCPPEMASHVTPELRGKLLVRRASPRRKSAYGATSPGDSRTEGPLPVGAPGSVNVQEFRRRTQSSAGDGVSQVRMQLAMARQQKRIQKLGEIRPVGVVEAPSPPRRHSEERV